MRLMFLSLSMVLLPILNLQARATRQYPAVLELFGSATSMLGKFDFNNAAIPLSAKYHTNFNGGIRVSLPVNNSGLYLDLFMMGVTSSIDKGELASAIQTHYADANYYITVTGPSRTAADMFLFGAGPGFRIRTKVIDINPHLYLAGNVSQFLMDANIERKKKNDNYSENISLNMNRQDAHFSLAIIAGVKLEYELTNWLYATAGINYTVSGMKPVLRETVKGTLLPETHENVYRPLTHTTSVLQIQAGAQFRFWKRNTLH